MTDTTDIAALREEVERLIEELLVERNAAINLSNHLSDCAGKLRAANAEIAALKAKLANPVVLKPAYKQSDYSLMGLEPSDAYGLAWGSSATRDDSVKQIREAGFTVKGE